MNTTHRINADLDSAAQSIANHLTSCAVLANGITQRVLALPDDELVAWLNAQGDPTPLFTAHGQLGEAINAAATVAQTTLAQWGLTKAIPTVDVRPVLDKLANQGRTLELTENGFIVKSLVIDPVEDPVIDPVRAWVEARKEAEALENTPVES